MSNPNVECTIYKTCDMKLLQSHLTAFLHFGFVFAVFGVLQFVGSASAAIFKLNLGSEDPLRGELIVEGQHKARHRDRIVILFGITIAVTVETVDTVILEIGYDLSVTSKTELLIAECVGLCAVNRCYKCA